MADHRSPLVLGRRNFSKRTASAAILDPGALILLAERLICPSVSVHCGFTLIPSGHAPETVAATDDLPIRLDWMQHQLQQGPAALVSGPLHLVASRDLATDRRWPDFGRLCVAVANLRSMVAVPIPLGGPGRGVLSFYAADPGELGHLPMTSAVNLARQARPALRRLLHKFWVPLQGSGHSHGSKTAIAVNLLMTQHGLTPAQAFAALKQLAAARGQHQLAVAIELVRSDGRAASAADLAPYSSTGGNSAARHPQHLGGPEMWRPVR